MKYISTKRDTYYLLVRFTPLADPSTELLGFVSESGGSLRFSILKIENVNCGQTNEQKKPLAETY